MPKQAAAKKKSGGLNLKALKQKADTLPGSGEGSDFTFWKPDEGNNKFRILPPKDEALLEEGIFYKEMYYHYGIGPENKAVPCPKKISGDDCYICEHIASQKKKGNSEAVSDLYPRARIYYNIWDQSEDAPNVKLYGSGIKIFKEIIGYLTDEEEGWGDITSLTEGRNINLERAGTGINTTYSLRVSGKVTDASGDITPDMLYDLEEVFGNVPTYEETKAFFLGDDPEVEEEESDIDDSNFGKSDASGKRTPAKDTDDDGGFLADDEENDTDF